MSSLLLFPQGLFLLLFLLSLLLLNAGFFHAALAVSLAGLEAGLLFLAELGREGLVKNCLLDQGEHTLGDPVHAQGGRHDEGDVDAEQRHHIHHGLHGCTAGGVRLRLGLHGELAEHKLRKTGQNGDQDHADHGPGEGEALNILPGSSGQIQTQELIVHVEPAIRRGKAHFLHGFDQVDLAVGGHLIETVLQGRSTGCLIHHNDVRQVNAGIRNGLHYGLQHILGEHHEVGDGLTDDRVQRHQNRQGEKAPEASAHGIDAFLFVELLHFLLKLGLVFGIALL